MGYTSAYKLFFLEPGMETREHADEEFKRWNILDVQLANLYSLFGNGVLFGWEIKAENNENIIFISAGGGHIGHKCARTVVDTPVTLTVQAYDSFPTTGIRYYIYGKETSTTQLDKSIEFFASTSQLTVEEYNAQHNTASEAISDYGLIGIGEVVLKKNEAGSFYINDPIYDIRDEIGLFDNISAFIKKHYHLGGANNPPKINLYSHVKGKLSSDNIEGAFDASIIQSGTLSPDRQAKFSHSELEGSGVLTHQQIEDLLAGIDLNLDQYLSDVAISNLMQSLLFLKAIHTTIDERLLNALFYIPGISPSSMVDLVNTTATIDTLNRQIVGILGTTPGTDYVAWNTRAKFEAAAAEFNTAIGDYSDADANPLDRLTRSSDIEVTDDGVILSKSLGFDDVHRISDSSDWLSVVKVLDNQTTGQGQDFQIGSDIGLFLFKRFKISGTNTIEAQDWTGTNRLQFSIELPDDSDSEVHGDVYLFLVGARPKDDDGTNDVSVEYTDSGVKDRIIVNRGVKIISSEEVTDGPKLITVDLLEFSGLTAVTGIGFYTKTTIGFKSIGQTTQFTIYQPEYSEMEAATRAYLAINDIEKDIAIYRYNTLLYDATGYLIFQFETPLSSVWEYLHYESDEPYYDGTGTLPHIEIQTRLADTQEDLLYGRYQTVSRDDDDYSLYVIPQTEQTKWIEIKVKLISSGDRLLTPTLTSLTLYYTTASTGASKVWTTYADFSGSSQSIFNINIVDDANPSLDRLELEQYDIVNTRSYVLANAIKAIDENDFAVSSVNFSGTLMPKTPIQAFFKMGTGFIHPNQFLRLETGNYLVADTGNDRVIEMDSNGVAIKIFQGNSYLGLVNRDLVVLTATYNSRLGEVAICFSQNIALADLDLTKFTISSEDETNRINLGADTSIVAAMLGSALIENLDNYAGTEYSSIDTTSDDAIGSQTQSGTTIIPGLGKTKDNIKIDTTRGAILIFSLTSARKAQIDAWNDTSKKIIIAPGAFVGSKTYGEAAPSPAEATTTTPTVAWFDAEKVSNDAATYTVGVDPNNNAFTGNYNPFIAEGTIVIGDYPDGAVTQEDLASAVTINYYANVPWVSYDDADGNTVYLTEPRYNHPGILCRMHSSFEYPTITDWNEYIKQLDLTAEEWTKLGDFNSDGQVKNTTLMDLSESTTILSIDVDDVDIVYWDILHPVSVEKESSTRYIIAQANKYSIIGLGDDSVAAWGIVDNVINFSIGDFGAARLLDNGNLLVSAPTMNMIAEVVIENGALVKVISTKYGPIDATELDNGDILTIISQKSNTGVNSRAYRINTTNNIVWEWGIGRLKLPGGIAITADGEYIVAC